MRDCPGGEDEANCADCDFEASTCNYKDQSVRSSYNWTRMRAGDAENGPLWDTTVSTNWGHYMLVRESGKYGSHMAVMELMKPLHRCSSTCELEFYYYIFDTYDTVGVYLKEKASYTELATIKGSKEDHWKKALLRLGRITRSFQLDFTGFIDRSFDDFSVAIDDIRMLNCEYPQVEETGQCKPDEFRCRRNACVPMANVCDLTDDCGDGSDELGCDNHTMCDFEENMCDWRHEKINNDPK